MLPKLAPLFFACRDNERGNTALAFALLAPVLIAIVGFGIDYSTWNSQKNHLQSAVDAAAIAAASELYLANATLAQVENTVDVVGGANLASQTGAQGGMGVRNVADFTAIAIPNNGGIHVTATQQRVRFLSGLIPMDMPPFTAEAIARPMGGGRVCAVMTDTESPKTFHMTKNAKLTASGCAIYSNSTHAKGLYVHNKARLKADLICSAGGKSGMNYNFDPEPVLDCPAIDDPLLYRPQPRVGKCDHDKLFISKKTMVLQPGVYCNGMKITNGAKVTMRPGIYVFKDGPIIVQRDGTLSGNNVGFFFTGTAAGVQFMPKSHIDLTAPKSGIMAGLLFFEDRSMPFVPKNVLAANNRLVPDTRGGNPSVGYTVRQLIASNDARNLLGTIYFPNGQLTITGKNPVADESAYTIIVAKKLRIDEGPNLILNIGYGDTDVPVPDGVGPVNATIALSE